MQPRLAPIVRALALTVATTSLVGTAVVASQSALAAPAHDAAPVTPSDGPRTPSDPAAQLSTSMMPADAPDAAVQGSGVSAHALQADATSYLTGVDVSSYQHDAPITWSSVASSGQSFVVVKATEGTTYTNSYEEGDVAGARAAGLRVGLYHFARPGLVNGDPGADAIAEADYFAARVNRVGGAQLPPTLDLEVNGGLSPAQLVAWTSAFLSRLQGDTGRKPMIYTGPSFWNTDVASTSFTTYPLWVAHYTTASAPQSFGGWSSWTFWQWTDGTYFSPGNVPGISGAVDHDRFDGSSLAALEATEAASNGISAPFTGTATTAQLPEGTFVRITGTNDVYVVAGRAPLYVSTLAGFSPTPSVQVVSAATFYSLRSQPLDGTFLRAVSTGQVYTLAGQAPVYVSSWSAWGGRVQSIVNVDGAAIDHAGQGGNWSHLLDRPLDGTFVLEGENGCVYRIAGGAPVVVSDWGYFGGVQPTVTINQATVDNAVVSPALTGPWSHLLFRPVDGTSIYDPTTGTSYTVSTGVTRQVARSTTSSAPSTSEGHSAFVYAGQPGVWAHLAPTQ